MSTARLILTEAGQERVFELADGSATLGRSALSDVVLDDDRASRTHARIERSGGRFGIWDLGSANGIAVNGARKPHCWLRHGDSIRIGRTTLRFEERQESADDRATRLLDPAAEEAESEAFTALVHHDEHPCLVLSLRDDTTEHPLLGDFYTVGRDDACGIVVPSDTASRRHAQIERRGRAFLLSDLGSSNRTLVNGAAVDQRVLQDGDVIKVGEAHLVFKAGFSPERLTLAEDTETRGRRRPVVFVPGFMGSELWRGSERLWPNAQILFRRPEGLAYDPEVELEPRRVLQELVVVPRLVSLDQYNRLGNYLEEGVGYRRGRDLLEFAYDWRQDCRRSARALGRAIAAWQDRSEEARGPVTIIAHSLGTIVSRYFVEVLGGAERVERMVLLGGPHFGAPHAAGVLATGPRVPGLASLGGRIRASLLGFPSIYQFLPTYPCIRSRTGARFSPLDDAGWVPPAHRHLLADARMFRNELGTRSTVPTVCIFGYGVKTTTAVRVDRNGEGWSQVELVSDTAGDGSVPKVSAVLPGAEIHPVRQHHGALYTDGDVRARLLLELTREHGAR